MQAVELETPFARIGHAEAGVEDGAARLAGGLQIQVLAGGTPLSRREQTFKNHFRLTSAFARRDGDH